MRDYQIRGLNWMISLYENGINGILADEMVSPGERATGILGKRTVGICTSKNVLFVSAIVVSSHTCSHADTRMCAHTTHV